MDPQHINPKDRLAEFTQQGIPLTQRLEQREAIIESRKNRLRSAQLRQKKTGRETQRNNHSTRTNRENPRGLHLPLSTATKHETRKPTPEDRFCAAVTTDSAKATGQRLFHLSRSHIVASMISGNIGSLSDRIMNSANRLENSEVRQYLDKEFKQLAQIIIKHFEPSFIKKLLEAHVKPAELNMAQIIQLKLLLHNQDLSLASSSKAEAIVAENALKTRQYLFQHFKPKTEGLRSALNEDFYTTARAGFGKKLQKAMIRLINPQLKFKLLESEPHLELLVDCFKPQTTREASLIENNRNKISSALIKQDYRIPYSDYDKELLQLASRRLLNLAS